MRKVVKIIGLEERKIDYGMVEKEWKRNLMGMGKRMKEIKRNKYKGKKKEI